MNLPIELPAFQFAEGQYEMEESLGIKVNLKDTNVRMVMFYRIDCVGEFEEDGVDYAEIFSGASSFLSPMTKKQIIDKLASK